MIRRRWTSSRIGILIGPRNISHKDTKMHEIELGTFIVDCEVHLNFGEHLMKEGIIRIINGGL